jgi:hypothetical protein
MDMFWGEGMRNVENELEVMGVLQSNTLVDEADIDRDED